MDKLIISDISVEKAIQKGLIKLKITRDEADVVVKQEGKKGLFGFGKKNALIEISKKIIDEPVMVETFSQKKDPEIQEQMNISQTKVEKIDQSIDQVNHNYQQVCDYLISVSKEYGVDIQVTVNETAKKINFQIDTDSAGLLIGKHGKIINALQVLAQTMVYRENDKAPMVVVNIGDYRQKREEKLKDIADKTAKRVLKFKQSVILEPLPAFERKIVHARLSRYDYIKTHSEGKEPYRYLIVDVVSD